MDPLCSQALLGLQVGLLVLAIVVFLLQCGATTWIHMPHALEKAYWAASHTKAQVLLADKTGLITAATVRIVLQGVMLWNGTHTTFVLATNLPSVAMQLLHLWAIYYKSDGYYKHQTLIQVLQRSRFLAIAILAVNRPAKQFAETWFKDTLASRAGSWRALMLVLVGPAALEFLLTFMFPLGMKPQMLATAVSATTYLILSLRTQLELLDLLQIRPLLKSTCLHVNALLVPWPAPGLASAVPFSCSSGSEHVFLAYVYLQAATALPLVIKYCRERSSKAAFLQQAVNGRGLADEQRAAALQVLHDLAEKRASNCLTTSMLCLWAWLSITWCFMTILTWCTAPHQRAGA